MFKGRTAFITGASRGIGKAIAMRLAKEGANIAVVAKSVEEDPRLGGTIHSTAKEINEAGGRALAIRCDIRDEEQILEAIRQCISIFGGIDILVNNASAINLSNTEATEAKRFDLMHDINVRGTFLVTKHCIPHLKEGKNPHILTLSPPLNLQPKWLAPYPAYAITKYSMTMLTIGWAEELKEYKIAANALWPATTIATAAVKNLLGGDMLIQASRKPDIIADAAHYILAQPSDSYTGQTLIDEQVLAAAGITDLAHYAINPANELFKDLFVD
ncbi:MAG: NAD(P)-dependent oxidoreductase [Sphingobacteriales bacterium]|nr:MAG: NAD(P)-dependent oxidoreductase [Sphingobacteriales bacterium]